MSQVNVNQLVFLDEAGSTISMTHDHAWAIRGERAHDAVPRNRGTVTTMLGAITLEGVTAMMTIEGGTCAEVFTVFVMDVLAPTLIPGDYVVLDNLGAHKSPKALAAIREAGAIPVFLTPYSPEFNPVEMAWSKLKSMLKDAKARAQETLDEAIAHAMELITPADIEAWYRHCGYEHEFA